MCCFEQSCRSASRWLPRMALTAVAQVQMNNLSPKFAKTFDIVWQFEIRQDLEVHVYDWDAGDVRTCDVSKQAMRLFVQPFRIFTKPFRLFIEPVRLLFLLIIAPC